MLLTDTPSSDVFKQLILIVVLILINAFFASSELAILGASDYKIEELAENGNKKAITLKKLKEDETKFLSTIQVGITLAGFFSSATAAVSLSEGLSNALRKINIPFAGEVAVIIVTLILSYFTLVFGELLPKRIALRNPEKVALAFARPINIMRIIFKPIVMLLSGSCELFCIIFRIKSDKKEGVNEDEIKALIAEATQNGSINDSEKKMIEGIFNIDDLYISDVMIPRTDVCMINIDDDFNTIKFKIRSNRYTRIPVYKESKDNIIGILNVKDIIYYSNNNFDKNTLYKILRKPYFISEAMRVSTLLQSFKEKKENFAVALDNAGSFSGIVTMKDLLEEIVGNIYDEYDEFENIISKSDDDSYIVDASISVLDLNKALNLNIEKDDSYSTLAGFITYKLERLANIEDTVIDNEYKFMVLEIENNRIKKVKISKEDKNENN